MTRTLVIRGGAIGDFILTLPVLAALRGKFPGARLEILGQPTIAALALGARLADAVCDLESPRFSSFFGGGGELAEDARGWFADFDLIISYLYDPARIFQNNVARCSGARFIAGPHRPDESRKIPASQQLLEPLSALGITGADAHPRLVLPGSPAKTGTLAIHPGSGSPKKNWPEAKWRELVGRLVGETNALILLVGGEAEGDRCARLAAALPAGRASVAQNMVLTDLAESLRACRAFAGHDSGITHLAAALGLPGVALWGETDLATWRPQSEKFKILRDPAGLAALPVDAVWAALQALL